MPGYLHPGSIRVMGGVAQVLHVVFGTEDALTFPVSGRSSAAKEAALANPLEPIGVAVVVENSFLGLRLLEIASRQGAEVVTIPVE